MICMMHDFNPRTREGCDVDRVHKYLLAHRISIHAPVKGATRLNGVPSTAPSDFNPRTREGCDESTTGYVRHRRYFNPRTREGCDLRKGRNQALLQHFNPRTREGCDTGAGVKAGATSISIHAPVKGATLSTN